MKDAKLEVFCKQTECEEQEVRSEDEEQKNI